MKRYWLFFGNNYYPDGGMEDLLSSHDTLTDAIKAFDDKLSEDYNEECLQTKNEYLEMQKELHWAHVFDSKNQKVVWFDSGKNNAWNLIAEIMQEDQKDGLYD